MQNFFFKRNLEFLPFWQEYQNITNKTIENYAKHGSYHFQWKNTNNTIANWKWNNATRPNPKEAKTCQTTDVLLKLLYWTLLLEFMSTSSSSLLPSLTPPPLHLLYSNHVPPVFPAGSHVQLFSTSQNDCRKASDVLFDIFSHILSAISPEILSGSFYDILSGIPSTVTFFWHSVWHSFWPIFWHSFWHIL